MSTRVFGVDDTCPNREQHTPDEGGYVGWFEWAAKMAKTHRQTRCPGCNRFAIWVPK